jgi:hypothetical protein
LEDWVDAIVSQASYVVNVLRPEWGIL